MKVVRCLERNLSLKELFHEMEEIFKKGNKVAITFKETTLTDHISCVSDGNDVVDYEVELASIRPEEVREGFKVEKNGEIYLVGNTKVVYDRIFDDTCGCILEAKPFTKKGCEEGTVNSSFEGYDDSIISIEEVIV